MVLMLRRHRDVALAREPRTRAKQATRDLEQRLERVDEAAQDLLLRERIHGRQSERVRVLLARLLEPRVDVVLERAQRVPRRGQELRERLARAEGVLAREERDADAGDLGRRECACPRAERRVRTISRRSLKTSATHSFRGMFSLILRRPVIRSSIF